jgi:peptidoglycan/LPS O-acetylase OafA/YrhL
MAGHVALHMQALALSNRKNKIAVESADIREGVMTISPERPGSIPALTGLRFAAALMVFFSHYHIPGIGDLGTQFLSSGYSGVTFFFVLSGFIITYNYVERFESNPLANTIPYFVSRFARIYPLYLLCIIYPWLTKDLDVNLLPYLTGVQAWSSELQVAYGINGPAWSVSVEIFLYLTFPILIPVLSKLNVFDSRIRLVVFAACAIMIQVGLAAYFSMPGRSELTLVNPDSPHRWLYRNPITRILDFCLGISAAIYYKRHFSRSDKTDRIWSNAVTVSIFLIMMMMGWTANYLSAFSWDASYAALFTIVILGIAINQHSVVAKAFSGKRMVMLGEASFAFYLIHIMVRNLYVVHPDAPLTQQIIQLALFLLVVISSAIGLHLTVERPIQKWILNSFQIRQGRKAS